MEKITQLTINRPNWLHGETSSNSYLYRPHDGKMCCLGFYGLTCGVLKDQMRNKTQFYESDIEHIKLDKQMHWLVKEKNQRLFQSKDANELMSDNDDPFLGEDAREAQIIKTFAKHGITVTFTDEPLPQNS